MTININVNTRSRAGPDYAVMRTLFNKYKYKI